MKFPAGSGGTWQLYVTSATKAMLRSVGSHAVGWVHVAIPVCVCACPHARTQHATFSPVLVVVNGEAPSSSRQLTTSSCESVTAMCSGVSPSCIHSPVQPPPSKPRVVGE